MESTSKDPHAAGLSFKQSCGHYSRPAFEETSDEASLRLCGNRLKEASKSGGGQKPSLKITKVTKRDMESAKANASLNTLSSSSSSVPRHAPSTQDQARSATVPSAPF